MNFLLAHEHGRLYLFAVGGLVLSGDLLMNAHVLSRPFLKGNYFVFVLDWGVLLGGLRCNH